MNTPLTPLLYSDNDVYRGKQFLIQNIDCELVLLNYCVPTINVLSKIVENVIVLLMKYSFFTGKHVCISHG